jgi:hypothetical protein
MIETNSLLLSSPLPRGKGKHNSVSGSLGTKPLRKFYCSYHVGSKAQHAVTVKLNSLGLGLTILLLPWCFQVQLGDQQYRVMW